MAVSFLTHPASAAGVVRAVARPAVRLLREGPVYADLLRQQGRGPLAIFLPAYGPEGAALLRVYNMATAMRMLKAKLWDLEQQRRNQEVQALEGDKKSIEWGSQIRSYVIHPYRQVNDLRTELKLSNVDGVLDGDLDPFMEAFLLKEGQPAHA